MFFTVEVTGDAFDFMTDAWDERESFTHDELGCTPDWADYVDADGQLFSERELEDSFEEGLSDSWGTVSVCGYEYDAGRALRELDPIAFRESFLDWIDAQQRDGELRSVER